jgi:hypothetical protein
VCFTDEEYQELTMIFEELESISGQQKTHIGTLEKALRASSEALTISEMETAEAQSSLSEAETSLQEERKATRGRVALAATLAVLVGFALGLLL